MQRDVREFNLILHDKLESKMKVTYPCSKFVACFANHPEPQGTKAEGAMAKLFAGKMKSYVKCVNVDYESSRIEEFIGKSSIAPSSITCTHLL
jgi:ubiquitin carboxyl-terminal hydrolase 7